VPGFTKKHLDLKNIPNWLTFLKEDLSLKALGLSVARLPAGKGYTIMHQHKEQEEVYMVLSGRGIIHIDGEDISLQEGDFINVVPESKRALKGQITRILFLFVQVQLVLVNTRRAQIPER